MRGITPAFDWLHQSDFFGQGSGMATLPRRSSSQQFPDWSLGVVRNHPVELTMRLCQRYALYLGVGLHVEYSSYDDTFAFAQPLSDLDSVVVWPDWRRIEDASTERVLANIGRIVDRNPRTIVVSAAPSDHASGVAGRVNEALLAIPSIRILEPPARSQGLDIPTTETWSGSEYSLEAHYGLAKRVAIGWLPSLLLPELKLVVVDLDNTLYRGVLGEDGAKGLTFGQGHAALARALKALQDKGVLVAVVSKNDPRDVPELDAVWSTDGFQLSDAAALVAGWGSKGEAIADLCLKWGIAPASVLFIDDNPGELIDALAVNPRLWPVHASDAFEAAQLLSLQLERLAVGVDTTGGMRLRDIQSVNQRRQLAGSSPSDLELHRQLGTEITSSGATTEDLERVADLLHRTNQFNVSLLRTNLHTLRNELTNGRVLVSVASVRDNLSESGVVAAVVARVSGTSLIISELAISCRVLGRGLESLLVIALLECFTEQHHGHDLWVEVIRGPRNGPAIDWVETVCAEPIPEEGGLVPLSIPLLEARSSTLANVVSITTNEIGVKHG